MFYRICTTFHLLTIKGTKKSKLTKELSENACEEVQVMGNIVGHCRRKRFHDGVNAEYSLKKLCTQKKYHISNSIMNGFRCKIIQRKQMEEENKSKDIVESQINIDISCVIPSSELWTTIKVAKVSIDRKTEHNIFLVEKKKKG